jgi:hypothetical protein
LSGSQTRIEGICNATLPQVKPGIPQGGLGQLRAIARQHLQQSIAQGSLIA